MNRHILAVIDGAEVTNEFNDPIYLRAETPLNHLGFIVDYVDITKKLPADDEMAKYGAVISWFSDNRLKGSSDYARWLTRQLNSGKKLIVLNTIGFLYDEKGAPTRIDAINEFYKAFGVELAANTESTNTALLLEVVHKDTAVMDFERKLLPSDLNYFERFNTTGKDAKVHLKLRRKDTGSTFDAVFTNQKGGAALYQYATYSNPYSYQTRWVIDPFEFFSRALGADFPKPDVTTLNGTRVFFSQIGDEGIDDISFTDLKTTCGELFYDKILTRYPLPATFGITVGRILSTEGRKRDNLLKMIGKILALPNIEPASDGLAAPKVWRGSKSRFAIDVDDYEYSPENEIGASIAYINDRLERGGKKTRLYLWTGDYRPDSDALKYVRDKGLLAINGGSTRFDAINNSYTFVSPLFFHRGDLVQYQNATGGEDMFTASGTGPLYGYRYVIETFERTGSPVRIRPVEVHTSLGSMKRQLGIDSLKEVYDWVMAQELAPVFTSAYVESLEGFLNAGIERMSADRWLMTNAKGLKTVRFDHEARNVDISASSGVIGFNRYRDSLYVHLNGADRSEIVLTTNAPATPYLISASGAVEGWKNDDGAISFSLRGTKHDFKIGGLAANADHSVSMGGKTFDVRSDGKGVIASGQKEASAAFEKMQINVKRK